MWRIKVSNADENDMSSYNFYWYTTLRLKERVVKNLWGAYEKFINLYNW